MSKPIKTASVSPPQASTPDYDIYQPPLTLMVWPVR